MSIIRSADAEIIDEPDRCSTIAWRTYSRHLAHRLDRFHDVVRALRLLRRRAVDLAAPSPAAGRPTA